jgi:hypothetical protein
MDNKELLKRIAQLESINDHLATEIEYVDTLMRMVGFKYGLQTVKATADEIIQKGLVESSE